MATPRRIFRIYQQLGQDAELIRDFAQAKGDKVSGTVDLLCRKDAAKLLAKWGVEMEEVCGVLDGTHDDPYCLEAVQTYYWAALYAVVQGATWEDLDWENTRIAAGATGIGSTEELRTAVARLVEAGPEKIKPAKLLLLWHVADRLYRSAVALDQQLTIEQIMECDLTEMKKREYLRPILAQVRE